MDNLKRTILFYFILMITITGCAGIEREDTVVKRTELDGNKVLIQEFSGDKLLREQEYTTIEHDSLLENGKYVEYYQNGTVKILGFYKMGIPDSSLFTYHANGNLSGKYYRLLGKAFALQEEYSEDGIIEKSYFKTDDHTSILSISYKNGKVDSVKGSPQFTVFDKNKFSLNEKFHAVNHVIVIKGFTTELKIRLFKQEKLLIDTVINKFPFDYNSHYYMFKYAFKEKGVYTYHAITTLTDNFGINNVDTSQVMIEVE